MLSQERFSLSVHHGDANREFAYDADAELGITTARTSGSTVVSMASDFATVF